MDFTQEVKQTTDPIYKKISKVMPEIEWSVHAPYIHGYMEHVPTIRFLALL